jgi:hypothetical protein
LIFVFGKLIKKSNSFCKRLRALNSIKGSQLFCEGRENDNYQPIDSQLFFSLKLPNLQPLNVKIKQ